MEGKKTKQVILDQALTLFAEKGFDAVSVGEIAQAVGIKAPSLYKHYAGKQALFDAILAEMARRYREQADSMQFDGTQADQDQALFTGISGDQLVRMGRELFLYFLHDEYTCKFRRLLTLEQYRSRELADLYARQYGDDPLAYQSGLFGLLMQTGAIRPENPRVTALQFYGPLYFLLNLCDCQPEREAEALQMLEMHIRQFSRLYEKERETK